MVKQVKQEKEKGKQVRIDLDLYDYIIGQTSTYGETFSDILGRLLKEARKEKK